MLADVPGFMVEDPNIRAVLHVFAKEGERIEAALNEIRDNGIPARVTALGASWHERQLGLVVNPVGVSLTERRERIVAGYQTKQSAYGSSWENDVTGLVGGTGWTYTEDAATATVTVYLPWGALSDPFLRIKAQIVTLASWPCHLDLSVQSTGGFILDQSQLDNQQFHP